MDAIPALRTTSVRDGQRVTVAAEVVGREGLLAFTTRTTRASVSTTARARHHRTSSTASVVARRNLNVAIVNGGGVNPSGTGLAPASRALDRCGPLTGPVKKVMSM